MSCYFCPRASNFFLTPKSYNCTRLADLPSSAPSYQFLLVHTALPALFPDNVTNPLPTPSELGLPKLPLLRIAHDRMYKIAGA
jgi:hypothetical protein